MRVAFDARHATRGLGISTFVVQLATELVAFDEIDLLWLGDPAYAPAGARSIVRADRVPYATLDGPAGRALARALSADIIHFTGNTGWGRRGPIPSVLTLHDLIFMNTSARGRSLHQIVGHRYTRRLVERAMPAATVLAVPSQTVAAEVTAAFGTLAVPHVIHEGVSAPSVELGPVQAGDDRPYIVAFAGRDPRKRTADVVAGWRSVAAARPLRLSLLAAGGLAPELRAALTPAVADGAVEIVDRHLPRAELWQVIAGAAALAYPSSHEGFGLPALEAMAAGTPVLAGLAPVTREIGGDAIVVLDGRDIPGSIAAAVRRLLDEPAYAKELRERGRARAGAFSWRATADRYRELYHAALSGGSA
jgi:glycosyltransferase involved in cell wall biosynthesis